MKQISKQEVVKLISKTFKINKSKINMNSSVKNIEEWDSINHLNLMVEIDNKLNGKAKNISDLAEANSLKKIYSILYKNKLLKR